MIDDSVTTKQTWPGDGSDRTANKSMKKYDTTANSKALHRRSTNLTATSGIYSADGSDSEGITTNIWSRLLSRSTSSASDYKNKGRDDEGSIDSFDNDEESNLRRNNSNSQPTTKSVLSSGCMRIKSTFQISAVLSTLRQHP